MSVRVSPPETAQDGRRPRRAAPAIAVEAVGAVTAVALVLTALHHVVTSPSASLLWYDGDSVLMPLVERSIRAGEPFQWSLSPALFLIPEIPVYLFCAAVAHPAQAALALNGALTVVGLYALLRAIAGEVLGSARRPTRVGAAVAGIAVLTVLVLTESDGQRNTLELATLLLTTTYYYGTIVAMLAVMWILFRSLNPAAAGRRRTTVAHAVVVGAIAAVSTASNPIFLAWVFAPVSVTVLLLFTIRRLPSPVLRTIWVPLTLGCTVGLLLRIPLRPLLSETAAAYVTPGKALDTAQWFVNLAATRTASLSGAVEGTVLAATWVVTFAAAVIAIRRKASPVVLVSTTLAAITVLGVGIGVLAIGSESTRYLQPIIVAPLVGLIGASELVRTVARRHRDGHTRRSWRRCPPLGVVGATLAVFALTTGVAVAPGTIDTVDTARSSAAACVDRWAAGRHVTGVGQFWTVRPIAAYTQSNVTLLQVRDDLTVYDWMVNLASYRNAHPTFVLVGDGDAWPTPVKQLLGDTVSVTHCEGFSIVNAAGTHGAAVLRQRTVGSAAVVRTEHGW